MRVPERLPGPPLPSFFGQRALSDPSWRAFRAQAQSAGLTRLWVVPRETVDQAFSPGESGAGKGASAATLAGFHPGFRRAVVLASPGREFWENFREATAGPADPDPNPLDRHTEAVVERLTGVLRKWDPSAVAVYPFSHPRQVLGFGRLLGESPWMAATPFGVVVDPRFGPWFAWRGAVLTALEWPPTPLPAAAPCAGCPAPCVDACPADVVSLNGLDWEGCAGFRLNEPTCKETCLARRACPVGREHRYGREQMAFHYRASLRMIQRWAGRDGVE